MQQRSLTFGSLFTGIGGFDLALERAGMKPKWQCEIDEFCNAVLNKHWPKVERWKDVRTFKPKYVDVICGGFPCQDLSVAGHGAGLEGERSGLWFEFDRIIGEVRPKYVLIENVPVLKSRGLDTVLACLAAWGYDAEWQCLPASAFGAYHQRDRIWIVAYPNSDAVWQEQRRREEGRPSTVQLGANGEKESSADADSIGRDGRSRHKLKANRRNEPSDSDQLAADARCKGLQRRQESKYKGQGQGPYTACSDFPTRLNSWLAEPSVDRVVHGVSNRVDRTKSLGNALVPQVAQFIAEKIIEREEVNASQSSLGV